MHDNLNSDLSTEATEAYFEDLDPQLGAAVKGMEAVETWTQDRYAEVQAALQKFADAVGEDDRLEMSEETRKRLIVLLGYISTGKAIKLLMWIEQTSPNFVAKTLAEAQMFSVLERVDSGAYSLFVERFYVLERLHMLSRIFSERRLELIRKIMGILNGEEPKSDSEE